MKKELDHPSLMFKKLVCGALAKLDDKDDWLVSKILAASSKLKRDLIHACLAEHKVNVLNQVAEATAKEHDGNFIVPKMLHGCSSQVVAKLLPKFLLSPRIGWARMIRFHASVVVSLMEADLAKANYLERAPVWTLWRSRFGPSPKVTKEFVHHSGQGLQILKLWEKFPVLSRIREIRANETELPENARFRVFPAIISENLDYYMRHHVDHLMNIFCSGVFTDCWGILRESPDFTSSACWNSSLIPFAKRLEFVKVIISKSNQRTFWDGSGADRNVLSAIKFATEGASEMVQLVDVLRPFIEAAQRQTEKKSNFELLRSVLANLLSSAYQRISVIATAAVARHIKVAQGKPHVPVNEFEAKKSEIAAKRDMLNEKVLLKLENSLIRVMNALFPLYSHSWRGKPPADAGEIAAFADSFAPAFDEVSRGASPVVLPRVAAHAFKLLQPNFTEMTKQATPKTSDENWQSATKVLLRFMYQLLRIMDIVAYPDTQSISIQVFRSAYPPELMAFAKDQLSVVHKYFLAYYSKIQVTDVDGMLILAGLRHSDAPFYGSRAGIRATHFMLAADLRQAAFDAIQPTTWSALAQNQMEVLQKLLGSMPLSSIQKIVEALLQDKKLGKEEKDSIVKYLRVDDPKNRKIFEKTASANNVADRQFGISSLIYSTIKIAKPAETLLTLKWLRNKIKNEAMEQRVFVFATLNNLIAVQHILLPKEHGKPQEFFDVYFQMLQDFLEAPDASEGPKAAAWGEDGDAGAQVDPSAITEFFDTIQDAAKGNAFDTKNLAYLDFAAELQWRQAMHSSGKATAASSFTISLSRGGWQAALMTIPELTAVIDKMAALYDKYLGEDVPEWRENPSPYFQTLFSLAHRRWFEVPFLKERAAHFLKELTSKEWSDFGPRNPYNLLSTIVMASPGGRFSKHPHVEALAQGVWAQSMSPSKYMTFWYKELGRREKALKGRAKHEAREKFVDELLVAHPDAIHIPLVWRTYFNRRTNKVDAFIGSLNSFRGPAFVEPDQRSLASKNVVARAPVGRRTARPARGAPPSRGRVRGRGGARGVYRGYHAPTQNDAELKMLTALSKMPKDLADHRDLFFFQPTHGLHRLLPRQSQALAEQYRRMIFNVDRPMPERVLAAVRYTLQPGISYTDMVKFFQERDGVFQTDLKEYKEKTAKGESASEPRPFATPLMEGVIKGLMSNDEPGAPLSFLLTPAFLGTDYARVAVFAVSRVVPSMPPGSLSKVLKLMLTGKRRFALKVTAFKEIIRMLMKEPSKEHLEIIKHEWNRPELHRDIRVVILTMALHALTLSVPEQEEIAWYILESPVSPQFTQRITNATTRAEIVTAILGAKPFGGSGVSVVKQHVQNARLIQHLTSLQKVAVPTEHFERYSQLVLKVAQTTDDADVRFIALSCLIIWRGYDYDHPEATEIVKFLVDFNAPAFSSEKRSDITRYNEQWRVLSGHLLQFCHMHGQTATVGNLAPPSFVLDVVDKSAKYTSGLPVSERKNRAMMLRNVTALISAIPPLQFSYSNHYTREDELKLLEILEKTLPGWFWTVCVERKIAQLVKLMKFDIESRTLFAEMVARAVAEPALLNFVCEKANTFLGCIPGYAAALTFVLDFCRQEWVPKTREGPVHHSIAWAMLESRGMHHAADARVPELVAFLERSIKFAVDGNVPAQIEGLPARIEALVRSAINVLCPYDSTMRTRTLSAQCIDMVRSMMLPIVTPATRNAMSATERALYSNIATRFLKELSEYVVQAIKEPELDSLLHLQLSDSLADLNDRAGRSLCVKLFNTIATRLYDTQGLNRLCALVEKVISLSLSGAALSDPKDYSRLSLAVAVDIVNKYPAFATTRPRPFTQFLNWVIATHLQDAKELESLSTLQNIIRNAFSSKELFTGRNQDVWSSKSLVDFLATLIRGTTISEPHPFSETLLTLSSVKSQYLLATQTLAFELLSTYGNTYRELTTKDTRIEWRLEFVALLDELAGSVYPTIAKPALELEVILPATKNDSAPKRKE